MFDFVIYICSYGMTCDETAKCVTDLYLKTSYRFEVRWVTRDALIGRSRSRAVSHFLWCDDSPYMIFVDGDIVFKPEDIEKIYRSMQAGYEVIGGMYAVAGASFIPAQSYKPLTFDGNVYEMRFISTGFMGITRNVLKQIRSKLKLRRLHKGEWCDCWPFFASGDLVEDPIYLSEDWDFCNKVREAGSKVYIHTGVKVGHLKTRCESPDEAIQSMVRRGQQEVAPVTSECLAQTMLIPDVCEFLGWDLQQVKDEVHPKAALKHAEEWKQWKGIIEDFYKENKSQFFDLVWFNLQAGYWQDRVNPIGMTRNKKILDLGCGIGTVSLFLAQSRNEVIGYDLNKQSIDFCNFRKKKFGLTNVEFTAEMPENLSDFDLIIAIDFLEHIKDLHNFLLKLGKGMKPDARLYHADVFGDQQTYPMHFDHSKHVDEWLKEAGFVIVDNRIAIKK